MARHSSPSAPAVWLRRRYRSALPPFLAQPSVLASVTLPEIDRRDCRPSISDSEYGLPSGRRFVVLPHIARSVCRANGVPEHELYGQNGLRCQRLLLRIAHANRKSPFDAPGLGAAKTRMGD